MDNINQEEFNQKADAELKKLPLFGIPSIAPYIRKHGIMLLGIVIFMLVTVVCDIILPLFQRQVIDNMLVEGAQNDLLAFTFKYLLVIAVQTTATILWLRLACVSEVYISRDLKKQAFDHLQTLSFSYFNVTPVGYIHSRVLSDPVKIGQIFAWGLVDSTYSVIYVIGTTVVMFMINPQLALLTLVIMPILVAVSVFFEKRLTNGNKKVREMNSRITGSINEGITGVKTSKTLVIEDKMSREFEKLTRSMRKTSMGVAKMGSAFRSIVAFCCSVTVALVLWRGGILSSEGVIKVGTLSVFITYALGMIDPIQMLAGIIAEAFGIKVNIGRLIKLLETKPGVTDRDDVIEKYGDDFNHKKENWESIRGDIEFENVDFKYPDGEEYILENFSLTVPAKTTVAIVGETGAGKSTLVNLVCRFFEPVNGKILIDGTDYRERSQQWLHSNLGYVLQTPHLFSGTIRENLEYGLRREVKATDELLMEAVRSVSAEYIIKRLEKGLDSDVGEGGNMLSTGEKQLISFARAILADPAIFVLDEATSSVDTMTEKAISEATRTLLHGRTSFIIAHRLSTIRQADIILVVEDGKIVERGSHDELIAAGGAYRNLYLRQFEEERAARGREDAATF